MVVKGLIGSFSLKRFDFKVVTFKLLSFILLFLLCNFSIAFASDRMLSFQSDEKKKVLGNFKEKKINWSIAICRGCSNQNVVIKSKQGRVLSQGVEGSFITLEPVEVSVEGKFDFDWRLDVRFSTVPDKPVSGNSNSVISKDSNSGGCCPNLSPIEKLLAQIRDLIGKIYDFLVSEKSVDKGMNDLKKSIDKLNDKFTPKKEVVSNLKSIGKGSSGTSDLESDLTIEYAKGVKFNTFDLTGVEKHLKGIRSLMSAIIWIEFAIFLIRIVVPKFKV